VPAAAESDADAESDGDLQRRKAPAAPVLTGYGCLPVCIG
ncbi:MAG: hypothetical protein QOJ34_664, partial [Pseudonocardiales bacterium]|nr:hypothetical protein [Pseudonocardiales bacterium]